MSDKAVFRLVMAVSLLVLAAVVLLNRQVLPKPETIPAFAYSLPALNAFINGTCSVLLLLSLYFIRRKNIVVHKRLNITTFILSSIFLVSYVTYHYLADDTRYGDLDHNKVVDDAEIAAAGAMRTVYFIILITHIILAAVVLPLVLLTFYRGLKGDVERHRKIARFTFPIWLYVTVTGVVVYLMISPYYNF